MQAVLIVKSIYCFVTVKIPTPVVTGLNPMVPTIIFELAEYLADKI